MPIIWAKNHPNKQGEGGVETQWYKCIALAIPMIKNEQTTTLAKKARNCKKIKRVA
jgi:hypothetical protein